MNIINMRPDGTTVVKENVPLTSPEAKKAIKEIAGIIGKDGINFIAKNLRKRK